MDKKIVENIVESFTDEIHGLDNEDYVPSCVIVHPQTYFYYTYPKTWRLRYLFHKIEMKIKSFKTK